GDRFRSRVSEAREALADAVGEERLAGVEDATRRSLGVAGRVYGKAEDTVSQNGAWAEARSTMEDLVDVVSTQHAMILDLLDRVERLERGHGGAHE
ncbi:hypothetical protein, partial [Pedococcus sp. 5OH_020]|uniref:hypothetical protein n=1 Tax=Pedococcus sp. 5OH_020 TaxID=2989814 RepID=UPI0022E9D4D4